jgi:DNA-binding CsgD family transcriptional regulator
VDSAFVDSIYQGAIELSPWCTFLRRLSDVCRAQTVTFIVHMPTMAESGLVFAWNADMPYQRKFVKEFYWFTPFQDLPVNKAAALDEVIAREELVLTDYYKELLVPARTEYILGMNVACATGDVALLTVSRTKEQGAFGMPEKFLLESLAEHLSRALSIYVRVHDLMHERAVFADALDQLHIGTILLDRRGHFLHANATANHILQDHKGIALQNNSLTAVADGFGPTLEKLIVNALAAYERRNVAHCEILKLPLWNENKFLHVLVRPSVHHSAIEKSSAPAVCVFVSVPSTATMPSPDVIRELFGFTRTESVVVSMLLAGLTTKEIAYQLDISLSTVRTHIKSTFAKAGVGRQSELVSSVLRSIAALA